MSDRFTIDDDEGLRAILEGARTVAVVGLSSDRSRPSYDVAAYLQRAGYDIVPVNPNEREVLGVKAVPDLASVGRPIDVVDVFRRSSQVAPHVEEAIAVRAKVLWLQDGVIDAPERSDGAPSSPGSAGRARSLSTVAGAARRAHDAGLKVVMDRCMLRDHARLCGSRARAP